DSESDFSSSEDSDGSEDLNGDSRNETLHSDSTNDELLSIPIISGGSSINENNEHENLPLSITPSSKFHGDSTESQSSSVRHPRRILLNKLHGQGLQVEYE